MPLLLGPAGYTRMMHPDGEIGAARSALRHGLPYTLSTMASTGIEELRAAVAGVSGAAADLWFQLYLTRNRAQAFDLVARAADNGYSTLVVTVDTIVAGNRVRDLRNGLSIPPALTLSTRGVGGRQAVLLVPAAVRAGARLRQLRRAGADDDR